MRWLYGSGSSKKSAPAVEISDPIPKETTQFRDYTVFPGGMRFHRDLYDIRQLYVSPKEALSVLNDQDNASAGKALDNLRKGLAEYWAWRNTDPNQTHDYELARDLRRDMWSKDKKKGFCASLSTKDSRDDSMRKTGSTRSSIYYGTSSDSSSGTFGRQ